MNPTLRQFMLKTDPTGQCSVVRGAPPAGRQYLIVTIKQREGAK